MRRIQIHLDEDVDEALRREAAAEGVSKAALIRSYLSEHVTMKRGTGGRRPTLIGVYEGTPDESVSINEVLHDR